MQGRRARGAFDVVGRREERGRRQPHDDARDRNEQERPAQPVTA